MQWHAGLQSSGGKKKEADEKEEKREAKKSSAEGTGATRSGKPTSAETPSKGPARKDVIEVDDGEKKPNKVRALISRMSWRLAEMLGSHAGIDCASK